MVGGVVVGGGGTVVGGTVVGGGGTVVGGTVVGGSVTGGDVDGGDVTGGRVTGGEEAALAEELDAGRGACESAMSSAMTALALSTADGADCGEVVELVGTDAGGVAAVEPATPDAGDDDGTAGGGEDGRCVGAAWAGAASAETGAGTEPGSPSMLVSTTSTTPSVNALPERNARRRRFLPKYSGGGKPSRGRTSSANGLRKAISNTSAAVSAGG